MKKLILSLCLCLSFCLVFTKTSNAEEYYCDETIEIISTTPVTRVTNSITGKKTDSIKNSSGSILWSVTVTGSFTYTGLKATCTSSSVSAQSNDSRWKISSKSHSKSGNMAKATASAKYYLDGSVISTQTKTVTLTCSATGKLS